MSSDTSVYIGTSGWSYDHWAGLFYPEEMKKNEWFPFFAKHFNTVELNMSFYRYPFENMLKGWQNKMPQNFKMTFKANRQITHRKKFIDVTEPMEKFYEMVSSMDKNAGCILFQTPPSFHCDDANFNTMLKFMDNIDQNYKNAIEFRHKSWWNEDVKKLLKAHNVAFCTVSGLEMPSDVMITADFGYFRFHGPQEPYASEYTEEQIDQWAKSIKTEIEKHQLKEVYCYFNNDLHGYALNNAKQLLTKIK